ncbi:hypothetical protein AVEN_81077-1 [Araneus ventricosus]|uniref:Serpin domain-containing protein n=1 Tax=Araneus ventricosus TaxID=182803 RepID=A0A4Y2NE34_ARAVE|nr:hypothetical protein AVEN_81077-1 [Araneus ventricosus]
MTSQFFTVDEFIEGKLSSTNLRDYEEECKKVIPPTFKDEELGTIFLPFSYVNSNIHVMTSQFFTVDEFIEGKLSSTNLRDYEEECKRVIPPAFKDEELGTIFLPFSYVNSNIHVMTSQFFTVDEFIEGKLSTANLSDDEEECKEVIPPAFKDAIYCTEEL